MHKFLKAFLLILNNQKGNLDLEGGEDVEANDDSEDLSTEGLLASLDSESEDTSENETDNEGTTEEPTPEGDDLEAQLEAFKSEDNPEANQLLEELNKLGILRDGLPVEFDDIEKVKENLSKGFDYTQKTQELSELRKTAEAEITQEREAFAQEREGFQKEIAQHEESLTNYNILQRTIADIQAKDPELFEELDQYYKTHEVAVTDSLNNPQVAELKGQIQELEKRLNGSVEDEEKTRLGEIKKTWESDVSELQKSFGPKLRSLGIKPDWAKVQATWSADTTNKLTVKSALFAEYGEQIQKAMANKSRIAETRAKVARTGSKDDNNTDEKIFGMTSGNSYENEAFEILKEIVN